MAREAGIPEHKIEATEKRLFADSVKTATLVGLGAYFITNHIPSAFELSVFTLEVISLSSPFTLDKLVVRANKKQAEARGGTAVWCPGHARCRRRDRRREISLNYSLFRPRLKSNGIVEALWKTSFTCCWFNNSSSYLLGTTTRKKINWGVLTLALIGRFL